MSKVVEMFQLQATVQWIRKRRIRGKANRVAVFAKQNGQQSQGMHLQG